jgi:hypothetical protein
MRALQFGGAQLRDRGVVAPTRRRKPLEPFQGACARAAREPPPSSRTRTRAESGMLTEQVLLMQMLSDPCLTGIREALTESLHLGVTVRQPLSTTRALFCSLGPASSGSGALLCRG